MRKNIFGRSPYRACFYGALSESFESYENDMEEIELLRSLLHDFKFGNLARVSELAVLVDSPKKDVRQYCHQLLAHVCNHESVDAFRRILHIELEADEAQRIIVRLGETLSLRAIPIIFDIVDELGDPELFGFASMALHNIFPWDLLDDEDFFESDKNKSYVDAVGNLDPDSYYYRGKPVFLGDVAKEFIASVTVSYKEKNPVVLVRQAQILSCFSGIQCPVENGDMVGDTEMNLVLDYIKSIAGNRAWETGSKYFYGNKIK